MNITATAILALFALISFALGQQRQVPEKYTSSVGGILLSIAVFVSQRA